MRLGRRALIVGGAAVGLGIATTRLANWQPDRLEDVYDRPRPLIFGHRGASYDAPENTLAAIELAYDQGADAVEIDVRLTLDDVIVVMHDDSLERTTDGTGLVRDRTYEEIRALDAGRWHSSAFAGARVPTLGEVLRYARGKLLVNVELKDESLLGEGLERRVAEAIARERMTRSVIVSSFNPLALWRIRRADPRLPTALLYSSELPVPLRDRWLMNLVRPDALHPSKQMASYGHIRAARARGHRVNVWTINDPETIRHLSWIGIDGIITDTPGKMVRLRGLA